MITEEIIKILITKLLNNETIKTKDLKKLGLTSYDLKKLVERHFLNRIKRGYYNVFETSNDVYNVNLLIELINNHNYLEAKKLFKTKANKNKNDKIVIALLDKIICINTTNTFPKKTTLNPQNIKEAVKNNNFPKALELIQSRVDFYNEDKSQIPTVILLEHLNALEDKFGNKKNKNDIYELILQNLYQFNTVYFKILLCEYLEDTKNEKYEGLIYALIEIDQIENSDYELTKNVLNMIQNKEFNMKRKPFASKFHNELKNTNYKNAEKYLKVVEALEDIKEEHTLHKALKLKLDRALNVVPAIEYKTFFDNDLKFLNKTISYLVKRKGIVLLNPVDNKLQLKIHEAIKTMPCINSKTLIIDGEERIMLSYVKKLYDWNNELLTKAEKTYNQNQTRQTIALHKKLLESGCNATFVYERIGLSYIKERQPSNALPYLLVAYKMKQEKNNDTEKLEAIIHLIKENTKKEAITEETFNNQSDSTYNIKNLSDILYLIYEEKYSIEDACMIFNLTEEEINLVKLLIAKEEYRNKNDFKADKLMKQVERSKSKNAEIKNLFKEITQNKLFYRNRPEESIKILFM